MAAKKATTLDIDLTHWVDGYTATLDKMREAGSLWVASHLPEQGGFRMETWIVEAEDSDTVLKLMRRWCEGSLLPRGMESASRAFAERVRYTPHSMLVVLHAERLRAKVLNKMRLLAEEIAPVVLVGDVVSIASVLDQSSQLRAHLLVKTTPLS